MARISAFLPVLLLAACVAPEEAPPAVVPVAATTIDPVRALAESVLERMGGREAWERTRFLHWAFFGRREHWWDKRTGDVRIEGDDLVLVMNVRTKEGRAWRGGREVVDPNELAGLMDRGFAWWVNDSYWMFMPYKLLDPGVRLRDLGPGTMADGRTARVLELTFDGVGLTPDNKYEVFVGEETGLVEQWSFYVNAADEEPRFTGPWSGWERFGAILLATGRGRGHDWSISVHDHLPGWVLEGMEPRAR
ncbi:MAG: hypothetical protein O7B99_14665 [Planctomycetota bacterium]|nr:hypothetical protein [Planctomycetota bacterium]